MLLLVTVVNGQPFFYPDTSNYVRAPDAAVVWLFGERFATSWTSADVIKMFGRRSARSDPLYVTAYKRQCWVNFRAKHKPKRTRPAYQLARPEYHYIRSVCLLWSPPLPRNGNWWILVFRIHTSSGRILFDLHIGSQMFSSTNQRIRSYYRNPFFFFHRSVLRRISDAVYLCSRYNYGDRNIYRILGPHKTARTNCLGYYSCLFAIEP